MNRVLTSFAAFVVAAAFAGGAFAAKEPKAAPASPALWRVSDADSDVYLFGTFAFLPEGAAWRSRALAAAIDASETLMFEAPVADAAAQESANKIFITQGKLAPGQTLSAMLAAENRARLAGIAEEIETPLFSLDTLKPWAAFVVLSSQLYAKDNLNPAEGIDAALLREAESRGRPVKYFDTVGGALALLTSMPEKTQVSLLEHFIADWTNAQTNARGGFEAWRTGDLAGVDAYLNQGMRTAAPEAYEKLVSKRNETLADRIAAALQGRGTAFVALNASYVVGPGSLTDALAARGFTVEAVGSRQ